MRYVTRLSLVGVLWAGAVLSSTPASSQIDTTHVEFDHRFWPWLQRVDERLLGEMYHWEYRTLMGTMRVLDETSYVIFYTAPFWMLGYSLLHGQRADLAATYRLGITEGIAYVTQRGLKNVFRRERPFYRLAEIPSKSIRYPNPADIFSFPSGHAMGSFAIASSIGLSYPYWYVVVPASMWAAGVALSRVWLGVHYPSDIVTGAVIGVAIGSGVHLLREHITPEVLRTSVSNGVRGSAFVMRFSIQLQ